MTSQCLPRLSPAASDFDFLVWFNFTPIQGIKAREANEAAEIQNRIQRNDEPALVELVREGEKSALAARSLTREPFNTLAERLEDVKQWLCERAKIKRREVIDDE